jgi:hypothetical protein
VELRRYTLRELKEFGTGHEGLYAVEVPVSAGVELVLFFSARDQGRSVGLKFLDVAEVIGPSQRAAAQKEAQRYL